MKLENIISKNKVVFIVWSNWVGKSTFCREFAKKNWYDYYNPIEVQRRQDIEIWSWKLGWELWKKYGTWISMAESMLQKFRSDGENYFDKLFAWVEYSWDNIILDEADKWLSMKWQWNYMHFIADQVNSWKKVVVVTHSYICIKMALDMWIYVYDMDSKWKFTSDMLPPL